MRNLANLVRGVSKSMMWGLLGAGLYGLVSCATIEQMTDAQKTALAGDLLMASSQYSKNPKDAQRAATAGAILSNVGQRQHEIDIANAGRDQITINNNIPSQNQDNKKTEEKGFYETYDNSTPKEKLELVRILRNLEKNKFNSEQKQELDNYLDYAFKGPIEEKPVKDNYYTPQGFFMYVKYVDFNADGIANRNEFIRLDEPKYDLTNLSELMFGFYSGGDINYNGDMNLKIWNMVNGKMIKNFNKDCNPSEIQDFNCESKYFPKSGKYKAVLNTTNKETFTLDFEITGVPKPSAQRSSYSVPEPTGFFLYNNWQDLNHNRKHERNEFSGLGKKVFNLDKESLRVGLNIPNATGEIIFRSYTQDGKLLGTTINPGQRIVAGHWTGPNASYSSPKDFIDKVRDHGPGKYTITVTFKDDTSKNYSLDFEIIK